MNKIESLLFYIILLLISTFFIKKVENVYKKRDKIKSAKKKMIIFGLLGVSIPIIIAAIRYQVGTDYNNYIDYYTVYSKFSIAQIFQYSSEITFILIIKIAYIFKEPQIIFGIIAFLTTYIVYKAILTKKEKISITLAFFLYLFLYYMYSLNIIRQMLAVAIVLYSYKYIIQNDFKRFLLLIIIASLFHTTAILFLPFYFLIPKQVEINKKLMFYVRLFAIISLLIVMINFETTIKIISQIDIFSRFQSYGMTDIQGENKQIIINTFVLFIILWYQKPLKKLDANNQTYIFLYIIGYVLTLSGFFSPYAKRIALYFNVSEIYLLASLPQIVKRKEQRIVMIALLIVYIIVMFVLSNYVYEIGDTLPYQTIFNKNM